MFFFFPKDRVTHKTIFKILLINDNSTSQLNIILSILSVLMCIFHLMRLNFSYMTWTWNRWKSLWEKVKRWGWLGALCWLLTGLLAAIDHADRVCRDSSGCWKFRVAKQQKRPVQMCPKLSSCLLSAAKRSIISSCVTDSRLWPFRHLSQVPVPARRDPSSLLSTDLSRTERKSWELVATKFSGT